MPDNRSFEQRSGYCYQLLLELSQYGKTN